MGINPSEIVYWELLPSIRREIVSIMREERGLKQVEIAQILGVTPSAISQYLKGKRGEMNFREEFILEIRWAVDRIVSGESSPFQETNFLIKIFEKQGHLCKICNSRNRTDSSCRVCY